MTKNSKAKSARRTVELERRERVAAMRKEAKAKERRRTIMVVGAGILASLLLIGVATTGIVLQNKHRRDQQRIVGLVKFDASKITAKHTTSTVKYAQTPPVGGDHDPTWLNCGIYTKPVRTENAVHDLEHGAVWVTYDPKLSKADIAILATTVRQYGFIAGQAWADLTPFTGLSNGDIYASAWGYQYKAKSASDPNLTKFLKRFAHGSQAPESGLGKVCASGGTGTPNG